jgi:thymidylate synthase (FAD)
VGDFEEVELRRQAKDNRQSSEEVFDPEHAVSWEEEYTHFDTGEVVKASERIEKFLESAKELYTYLLEAGIARECARMILPMCTQTTLYMTGNIRSWIHFLDIRDDEHAQKEMQLVAKEVKKIFIAEFPIISQALKYE